MKNLKNKKGITLVEVIVVLVIMAILAGILVGAYSGYINRAKEQNERLEVRAVVLAATTLYYEDYAANGATTLKKCTKANIKTLAGVDGTVEAAVFSKEGELVYLKYKTQGDQEWYYNKSGTTESIGKDVVNVPETTGASAT